MQKISLILLISGLLFSAVLAMAQEDAAPIPSEAAGEATPTDQVVLPAGETTTIDEFSATLDETVEDLGIGEPNILPDSPFYFLKEWSRTIQSVFAFSTVAKAQLKEKFSSEKLLEVKKMVEQNKNQEQIENAVRSYQKEIGEMAKVTERIRETAEESEQVGQFLDKFIQQQTVHQRVLQKLEEQVPQEVFEKIQEVRNEHLEKFGEIMTRLENKENLQERLEQNLQEMAGSEFKEFKNLEILKQLEEKVPEEAKEAIRGVQENLLIKLKEKLEQLPPQTQEKFQDYVEKISGEKETQLEIVDSLKEELKDFPLLKENLLQLRERIMEQIRERIQQKEQNQTMLCPEIEKPAATFCQEGRIIIKKDEQGCIIEFKCVIPAQVEVPPTQSTSPQPVPKQEQEQTQACIQLWNPVCGKDGKTYSNECFAKVAGIEVAYEEACEETETEKNMLQQQLQQFKELLPGTSNSK